jgi:hypothetical protein
MRNLFNRIAHKTSETSLQEEFRLASQHPGHVETQFEKDVEKERKERQARKKKRNER